MEDLKIIATNAKLIAPGEAPLIAFEASGLPRLDGVPIIALDQDHMAGIIRVLNIIYLRGVVDGRDEVMPKWKETLDAWGMGLKGPEPR